MFGIARNVFARYCGARAVGDEIAERRETQIELSDNGFEELAARIDAQRAVTEYPNGTLTLSVADITNVAGLNAEFRKLGAHMTDVPITATAPRAPPTGQTCGQVTRCPRLS